VSASPLVSIVITNYNYASFVEQAILSSLNQGIDGIEVIVVDDGSSDGSGDILERYQDFARIIRQENAGACAARNSGLAVATGKYVKFLDADDWLVRGAIAFQLKISEQFEPSSGFAVSGVPVWQPCDQVAEAENVIESNNEEAVEIPLIELIQGSPLTSCPLHHRVDLLSIGGFDERLRRGQEHDLHVRLALNGVRFYHTESPVYFYRQHDSATRISDWKEPAVAQSMHDASRRRIKLAEQQLESPLSANIREAFAKRLWRDGRECLQRGAHEHGSLFFQDARKLYPVAPMYGDGSYRLLAKLVGPERAERLSQFRAILINRFRRDNNRNV